MWMFKKRIPLNILFFAVGFIAAIPFQLSAQSETITAPTLQSLIPASPNAASLGKYGEIPVGYYAGIPSIDVPIYEINTGSLKLPIGLSYHAGGIKVEEIASWAGLGWSLDAGGVITRQVRGLPDELAGAGYLYNYRDIYQYIAGMSDDDKQTYLDNVGTGSEDSEPDIFSFNFGSESGRFFFDTTGQVTQMPATRNKFEFGTFIGVDNVWKVTDIKGYQYYFIDKEVTSTIPVSSNSRTPNPPPDATTSWYLTSMINALGTDTIKFVYEFCTPTFNTISSQTKYLLTNSQQSPCSTRTQDDSYSINTIYGQRLTSIIYRNGTITFTKDALARCDYSGDNALTSIEIKTNDGQLDKKIQLYQHYLTASPTPCLDLPENSRLLLDSLTISDANIPAEKYGFNYNVTTNVMMPSRMSYNQDRFGYFNGADNGSNFIPESDLPLLEGGVLFLTGANRDIDTVLDQALMLTSITYPTGGNTAFEYENNRVGNLTYNPGFVTGNNFFWLSSTAGQGTNGPRLFIDTTFTITDDYAGLGGVNASIFSNNGGGDCATSASHDCPNVSITGPGGVGGPITGSVTTFFPQGSYHVVIDLSGPNIDPAIVQNYYLQITWQFSTQQSDTTTHNVVVGGLRVKKITNYNIDGSTAQIKRFTYSNPDNTVLSSGAILSIPTYVSDLLDNYTGCDYQTISSGANYPLLQTQSSYVGYRYVQELLGENGEFGKNEYEFTAPESIPDRVISSFPFPPATSFDWKRGKQLYVKSFRYNAIAGNYDLVQEKINSYADIETKIVQGLQVGQKVFNAFNGQNQYSVEQFSTEAGWYPLVGDTIRTYDQQDLTRYQQTVHSYSYNPQYFLPVTDTSTNSKGQTTITVTQYPFDFTGLTATDNFTAGIVNLQNRNMVATPVEKYTILKSADGSSNVTGALLTSYRATVPLADTVWALELPGNGTSNFTPAVVSSGRVVKNGLYLPQLLFPRYDQQGNIVEQQKIYGISNSYIWDYLKMYPIAEVKNADSASIAYTSFEADGDGGVYINDRSRILSTDGVTGGHCYSLDVVSRSGLDPSKTYIVSIWAKNGIPIYNGFNGSTKTVADANAWTYGRLVNGWTYLEKAISGVTTINVTGGGTGLVDEVRFYPSNALMTTYTYAPLVGLTSQCDMSNRITYYKYDGLGRLNVVRDQDGNIVKTFDYHYSGQ